METEIKKACPYCGQMWCLDSEEERPEEVCRCPGAMLFQEREANTVKMQENLRMVFGEGCDALESKFKPVDEEIYALLSEIVQKVGHEEIGTVSFGLKDGSSGKISVKGIERKKNISMKLGS